MANTKFNDLLIREKFYHHFQPIFNLTTWKRIGSEALIRSPHFENPEAVFIEAKRMNKLMELESMSVRNAIFSYSNIGNLIEYGKLFINLFPSTLASHNFPDFMKELQLNSHLCSEQIIIEINESDFGSDLSTFKCNLSQLKKCGFLIAIDDFGKGTASLRTLVELDPDIVKVDRFFAKDLDQSGPKQEMMKSILTYCENTNTKLILEGIEKSTELAMAKALGVTYGQGYLLGKPASLQNEDSKSRLESFIHSF